MSNLTKKKYKFLQASKLNKTLAAIFAIVLVLGILEITNTTHLFHKDTSSRVVVTVGKPIAPPKTTSSIANTNPKDISNNTPSTDASRNPGTAVDTKGAATTSTDSNQWATSASGVITVKQPAANSRLQDGDTIAGSAKLDQVNYRLKDNKVGVVSQGILSVVNGNFSGTLHFTPQGTGGQLDVFSTDSNGVEYNEIQINVSF